MAERRMFSKKVTDDDAFMSLSSSAQALYLHLSMSADDDGFSNQVALSMFKAHASVQDLEALLQKRFIFQFENGVIVIKHWKMANALRKDRYTKTIFREELAALKIMDNGTYSLEDGVPVLDKLREMGIEDNDEDSGCQLVANMSTNGCQLVASRLPQDSIGKNSIVENSIEESKEEKAKREKSEAKQAANLLFEKMWKLYPVKRGKASVKDAARLRLLKVGEEQIRKSIKRYLDEREELRASGKFCPELVNGSTFFNSRYIDYLDENYLTNDHADIRDDDHFDYDDSPFGDWQ